MHSRVPVRSPALLLKGPRCSPALPGHKGCTNPAGTTRDRTSTPTSCNHTDSSLTEFLAVVVNAQVYCTQTQMFSVSMGFLPNSGVHETSH